jgi:hypothetical protein
VKRGTNRLTRDNAGRITSAGGEGATARGGRLRTAAGNLRATQTAKIKGSGGRLRKPVGGAQGAAKVSSAKSRKADLSDAGFSRRLSRAKSKLSQAEKNYESRGSSIYDKQAREKVMVLRSAVSSLSGARKRVRDSTVPPSQIKARLKEGKKDIVDNYRKQIGQIKREAASTAGSQRRSTAPRLSRSEKAAVTRRKNADKRSRENIRRMEQDRARSR